MARTAPSVVTLALLALGGALAGALVRRPEAAPVTPDRLDPSSSATRGKPAPSGVETVTFRQLSDKLREEYVDDVPGDLKLASGAVKGMVGQLDDPDSLYFEKAEFAAESAARKGKLEGIGARFALVITGGKGSVGANGTPEEVLATVPRVARLMVSSVAPGGPADRAGVKTGDFVYEIDGRWLVNTDLLLRFREASKRYDEKKITITELNRLRKEVIAKSDRALLPLKARALLTTGATGVVKVTWERGTQRRDTEIARGSASLPGYSFRNGVARLPLDGESAKRLAADVKGQPSVTIDLRGQGEGSLAGLKTALNALAPKGDYGRLKRNPSLPATPLVSEGPGVRKVVFLVDRSVRGPAQILARAMVARGKATLSGPAMYPALRISDLHALPDGTGYSLAVAEWTGGKA